jgi:hypothetical protein
MLSLRLFVVAALIGPAVIARVPGRDRFRGTRRAPVAAVR